MSETAGAVRPVLQKLLTADLGRTIVEDGYDQVGGIVVQAGDVPTLVKVDGSRSWLAAPR